MDYQGGERFEDRERDEMLTDRPATDAVCFHMQQCVEKYLKAFLIFNWERNQKDP